MGDYRALKVFDLAHKLALDVYRTTHSFPKAEMYVLATQMRRAAVSIPANLAEGSGRGSDRELARFARISLGSLCELEYYVHLANELGYLEEKTHQRLLTSTGTVMRMLARLATVLSETAPGPYRPAEIKR